MKKQTKTQKGFAPLLVLLAVVVVVVITAIFLSTRKGVVTQQGTQSVPVIQNAEDLSNVDSELDDADLNEFDKELNKLDTDASTF